MLCFRKFKSIGALQKKIINFIVTNLLTDREADHYRQIYYDINTPADGMCTKEQFITAFWNLGFTEMSEHELDALLAYIDDDRNGFVEFDEFLRAAVHPDDVLKQSTLRAAFKMFDEDQSGSISIDEFKVAVDPNEDIPDS